MKKAQFDVARKTIFWMIAGIAISVMVVFFAFIVGGYKSKLAAVPAEVKAEFISLRFTNIAECFAYTDVVVHPGIVDMDKFTPEQMLKCYKTESERGYRDFNFRLELNGKVVTTNNYFKVDHFKIERKVLVKEGENTIPGLLTIYVREGIPTPVRS